jgi:hypothetical protein
VTAQGKGQIVQRVIDAKNVEIKATKFIQSAQEEWGIINTINMLLAEYSRFPTVDLFEMARAQIQDAREKIKDIHNRQAALLGEYLDQGSDAKAKQIFLRTIIPHIDDQDIALVNRVADKVQKQDPTQPDDQFEHLRNRYLSFVVQVLSTKTGTLRLREFNRLLGDENIRLDLLPTGFQAGFANDVDTAKSQKQEDRDVEVDQKIWKAVGENIPRFIEERFGKMGEDRRTPNLQTGQTGDLLVYLEKFQKLFPLYIGQGEAGQVAMFTSPLFTAIHHETGHVVNLLKRLGGGENKYTSNEGPFRKLADEEEVYNISVDRYSDKAMSQELGLPERIAHGSFMALYAGNESFSEREAQESMQTWGQLTGQRPELSNPVRDLQVKINSIKPADAASDPPFRNAIADYLAKVEDCLKRLTLEKMEPFEMRRLADAIGWSLNKLERKVYERMDQIQPSQQPSIQTNTLEFQNLRQDLEQIQAMHRQYISTIIDYNLPLWAPGSFDDRNKAVLVNAIREKLLAIANKPEWDTLGGWFKKKTPEGIVSLRQLLAQQNVNWQAVRNLVHEKNQRNSVETFLLAVPSALSGFYIRIEQFCDLYASKNQNIEPLRAFLDGIKHYNPI